jgi:type II secretory pathway component PulM
MNLLAAWWRARSSRERLLMRGAAVLALAVLAPSWAYLAADRYRAEGAVRVQEASQIANQVEDLERIGAAAGRPDASLQEKLLAAAGAHGLSPPRFEAAAPERVTVVFAASDANLVQRWMGDAAMRGVLMTRTVIVRVGESNLVDAEFEAMLAP